MCRAGEASNTSGERVALGVSSKQLGVWGRYRSPLVGVRGDGPENFEVFCYTGHVWALSRASQDTWKD